MGAPSFEPGASQSLRTDHSEPISLGYVGTVLGLMVVLPLVSVVIQCSGRWGSVVTWGAVLRWFVFWGVGLRLFIAGIRQVVQPSFTAREIFHLQSPDANVIVRELGFANICLGLTGIVAGFCLAWRLPAAFGGGLYFGIAGAMHSLKRPSTPNEWVALVSDLGIFGLLAACFAHALLAV